MKAEPGSFYLGVIDVFSIMLPGALLVYFLPQLLEFGPLGALGALLQESDKQAHEWLHCGAHLGAGCGGGSSSSDSWFGSDSGGVFPIRAARRAGAGVAAVVIE